MSAENVERVRDTFLRSPKKSTVCTSRELGIPQLTVWRVLRKKLCYKPYKLQSLQALRPSDQEHQLNVCVYMLEAMEADDICTRLVFNDETTFHLSGKVNRHNVSLQGLTNPHIWIEHERDSSKVNVFRAMSVSKIYGPFFFTEKTVTDSTYLDMLEI
ncbi:hypothetical protein AVEN_220072-1 [Araneus ventricosus]|uniref:Uncharacterized protein n=1 Tax=Araneus ventricosus TaxID=182803 RepID=A0A4Y2TT15_ARAVE|nr:hypothetical protein AVEN_38883-1 [Araneus ventricosus]GBO03786.1 hypothetical protein AVEN_220072-1 [Araneus ventricosus]